MKPGDRVRIIKGPCAGDRGVLKRRVTEKDTKTKEIRPAWMVWIGLNLELVYEDEIGGKRG